MIAELLICGAALGATPYKDMTTHGTFDPGWGECGYVESYKVKLHDGSTTRFEVRCTERAWPVGTGQFPAWGSTSYEEPGAAFLVATRPTGKTVVLHEVRMVGDGGEFLSYIQPHYESDHNRHWTEKVQYGKYRRTGKKVTANVVQMQNGTEERIKLACHAGHLTTRKVKGEAKP